MKRFIDVEKLGSAIYDDLENFLSSSFDKYNFFGKKASFPCAVYEQKTKYTIICKAAGVKKKDVQISATKTSLTIEASAKLPELKGTIKENDLGPCTYKKTFDFESAINKQKITHSCSDGILTISIPKI